MILTKKQGKVMYLLQDNETTEILFGGGAGGGKSELGCKYILNGALKYPETHWLLARETLLTLKNTTLLTFFRLCRREGIENRRHYVYNSQTGVINFNNGSKIFLKELAYKPSDPNFDELGSLELTGGFVDEVNQVTEKAIDVVILRIRHMLERYNLLPRLLMSCNPAKNWVYKRYYLPSKEGKLPAYRKFVQALVTDNPHISPHYITSLERSPEILRQRLLKGNWEYDGDLDRIAQYDEILNVFTNSFVPKGKKRLSGDVARFGKDRTVIFVWSGMRIVDVQVMDKSSIPETYEAGQKLSHSHAIPANRRIWDEDGVGGGVKDMDVGSLGFVNNSSPIDVDGEPQNFVNLRSQCYYMLMELIRGGGLFIEEHVANKTIAGKTIRDYIVEELDAIRLVNIDKDAKIEITPKEKIKEKIGRSPDFSDGIMMRMFFKLKKIPVPSVYY